MSARHKNGIKKYAAAVFFSGSDARIECECVGSDLEIKCERYIFLL